MIIGRVAGVSGPSSHRPGRIGTANAGGAPSNSTTGREVSPPGCGVIRICPPGGHVEATAAITESERSSSPATAWNAPTMSGRRLQQIPLAESNHTGTICRAASAAAGPGVRSCPPGRAGLSGTAWRATMMLRRLREAGVFAAAAGGGRRGLPHGGDARGVGQHGRHHDPRGPPTQRGLLRWHPRLGRERGQRHGHGAGRRHRRDRQHHHRRQQPLRDLLRWHPRLGHELRQRARSRSWTPPPARSSIPSPSAKRLPYACLPDGTHVWVANFGNSHPGDTVTELDAVHRRGRQYDHRGPHPRAGSPPTAPTSGLRTTTPTAVTAALRLRSWTPPTGAVVNTITVGQMPWGSLLRRHPRLGREPRQRHGHGAGRRHRRGRQHHHRRQRRPRRGLLRRHPRLGHELLQRHGHGAERRHRRGRQHHHRRPGTPRSLLRRHPRLGHEHRQRHGHGAQRPDHADDQLHRAGHRHGRRARHPHRDRRRLRQPGDLHR